MLSRLLFQIFLSVIVFIFVIPSSSLAEDSQDPTDVQMMDPVVISATKTPIPLGHVTSAVEVITGQDMERKKLRTVVDALRLAQGVAIFSSGGPGTSANARIRGGNSEFTLVLVDGAIVNSPTLGSFDFSNLTAENIDRIEILRGSQSMLWGSDAISGVINIITKRGKGKPKASAFFEYGSFTSLREGGQVSGQAGPVDFSILVSRWDLAKFSSINVRRGASERDPYRNWQVSSRFGVNLPKEGKVDFTLRYTNADSQTDGFAGNSDPADIFNQKQTTHTLVMTGVYAQPITNWWTQKLTLSRTEDNLEGNSGDSGRNVVTGENILPIPGSGCFVATCFIASPIDINFTNNRIEWQHNFQIVKPIVLVTGYQFREQLAKNPNAFGNDQKRLTSHAGFMEFQGNLFDRVFFSGGFRIDSFNTFGEATTYRVTGGYLHKETGTKLRGSYATGFRAPTMNQLFFTIPGFFTADPTLQPVKSKSFDVAIEQKLFQDRVNISLGYFWTRFTNLIAFDFSSFPGTTINIGLARTWGYEAGIQVKLNEMIEVSSQYTYTSTRDLSNQNRLPRWPVHQGSAVIRINPIKPLNFLVMFQYVGIRFNEASNTNLLGAYEVVNVTGTYDVNNYLQVYTRVDNLLDDEYEEIRFFGTPTRSIYVGANVKFDVPLPNFLIDGAS